MDELASVLLHAFCERNIRREGSQAFVQVTCPCLQTHSVSPWGFMILAEVEASLGSRAESKLVVDTVTIKGLDLIGLLLMTLASKVASQQVQVKKLDVPSFACNSDESAEAFATLVEQSEAGLEEENSMVINIYRAERQWGRDQAIARAAQHVYDTFGHELYVMMP